MCRCGLGHGRIDGLFVLRSAFFAGEDAGLADQVVVESGCAAAREGQEAAGGLET